MTSLPNPDLCLIPLYMGITGHRNIREEDKPVLKQLIKSILLEKVKECPDTPVKLITPLAEGADRLAAWAAIECNIPFIAPLPMPVKAYCEDFKTPGSLDEFNELLNKAESWFELPLDTASDNDQLTHNQKRDDQYYQLGHFVARNCCQLIALWDGTHNNKKGGTAQIVKLKLTGLPQSHPLLQQHLKMIRSGSICHIVTPRDGDPVPEDAFTLKMLSPESDYDDHYSPGERDIHLLKHIDSFNRDVLSFQERSGNSQTEEENGLQGSADLNNELNKIGSYHRTCDSLALKYHLRRFLALKVLLVLTVSAFMFFQIYVEFWHKPFILMLYPLTMGMGALWFLHANRRQYEQKHEDYRALAEAYRVQYFLCKIRRDTHVSDYYLQKYAGDLEWILYALRATLLKCPRKKEKKAGKEKMLKACQYVNDYWVSDQLEYFRQKSMKNQFRHERLRYSGNTFFISALASAFLLLIFSLYEGRISFIPEHHYELVHGILVVCTHSFLVISGAIFGYNEKRIFAEQSKTFQKMYHLFSHAYNRLSRAIESKNIAEAENIIHELALESLMENADWLLLHRSRPMEIPRG